MFQPLYKRAACTDEFFDLINTAHVENGHIGLSQTYAAVSWFILNKKDYILLVTICVKVRTLFRLNLSVLCSLDYRLISMSVIRQLSTFLQTVELNNPSLFQFSISCCKQNCKCNP